MLSRESTTLTINEIDRHKSPSPSGTLSSIIILNEDQTTSTPPVLSHHLVSGQSALGIDIFPQTSQSHIATPHPGPTRLNQLPNSTLSNSTEAAPPSQHPLAPRAYSALELAELARLFVIDDPLSRPFNTWIRTAVKAQRDAKKEKGNIELAFVEYTKVVIVLREKIPFHPGYRVHFSRMQRQNLGLVSYICLMDPIASVRFVIHVLSEWFNEWFFRGGMEYHFGVLVMLSRLSFGHFHLSADSCSLGIIPLKLRHGD